MCITRKCDIHTPTHSGGSGVVDSLFIFVLMVCGSAVSGPYLIRPEFFISLFTGKIFRFRVGGTIKNK